MHVHGDNLRQKETHRDFSDETSVRYLAEIREQYSRWKEANTELKGPLKIENDADVEILQRRVDLFSEYKAFVDQRRYAEHFDSRGNLHSSMLEEFMYYIFRDLVLEFSELALIGKAHTFKDIFFNAPNYAQMVQKPYVNIERKDHDFTIGVNINAKMSCAGVTREDNYVLQVPAVAIECKTYLDKNMLEGCSTSAEQLKHRNPNALYIVVAEWLKLAPDVNLRKFKLDQVYILRKQKNTDRKYRYRETYNMNPIYVDVVVHLFNTVRNHLTIDWEGGVSYGLDRGYLL